MNNNNLEATNLRMVSTSSNGDINYNQTVSPRQDTLMDPHDAIDGGNRHNLSLHSFIIFIWLVFK